MRKVIFFLKDTTGRTNVYIKTVLLFWDCTGGIEPRGMFQSRELATCMYRNIHHVAKNLHVCVLL